MTAGLKGIKRDSDTSKVYNVTLHESAGWVHVSPGKYLQEGGKARTNVSKEDMLRCLDSIVALRVRGGYYSGPENTQLRWALIKQVRTAHAAMRAREQTDG
jgi:hypothetical protein